MTDETPQVPEPAEPTPPPPAPALPPEPAAEPGQATPVGDQHAWQMIAHASALIQFIGIPSFVGPLVVWLIKRDDPLVRPHAREALNYQLSLIIYFVVGIIVAVIAALTVVGLALTLLIFLFLGVLLIAEIVFAILATVAASKHQLYRYPMSINLIK